MNITAYTARNGNAAVPAATAHTTTFGVSRTSSSLRTFIPIPGARRLALLSSPHGAPRRLGETGVSRNFTLGRAGFTNLVRRLDRRATGSPSRPSGTLSHRAAGSAAEQASPA